MMGSKKSARTCTRGGSPPNNKDEDGACDKDVDDFSHGEGEEGVRGDEK